MIVDLGATVVAAVSTGDIVIVALRIGAESKELVRHFVAPSLPLVNSSKGVELPIDMEKSDARIVEVLVR